MIEVDATLYAAIAVLLALIGVFMARLVTINDENQRLGRRQTWRETGPLTWIGVLIVCPFIWHFEIAIPYASLIGLGVGYTVRMVMRIVGEATVGIARAMAERTLAGLKAQPDGLRQGPPQHDIPADMQKQLQQLDEVDEKPAE